MAGHWNLDARKKGSSVFNHLLRLTIAGAALAAGLCVRAPVSGAAGVDEPWCILDYEGNSHCYYRTSQDCLRAIANGSRGFCNTNPSPGLSTLPAETRPAQSKRRAQ
jgi:Protein of unknown function (DUF3551)